MSLRLSRLGAIFPLKGAVVLVVDDEINNTQQMRVLFESLGCTVYVANSTEQARAILAKQIPDVMLLDIMMPGQDGISFCAELKRDPRTEDVNVIFISGRSELPDKVKAFEVGGADFVSKPFEPIEVLARLSHQFKRRQMEKALREERELLLRLNQQLGRARQQTVEVIEVLAEQLQGKTLDNKYRLESLIGTGGSAMVYRATQLVLQRSVAVKVLRPSSYGRDAKQSERFQRETQLAARIHHPNVTMMLDAAVSSDGLRYLVMELLSGGPLSDLLRSGRPLSVARTLEVMIPICSAIACAHRSGVVHRDIKPSNIFLHHDERGEIPKLLDFGIALPIVDDDEGEDGPASSISFARPRRRSSDIVGTINYMSIEQMDGQDCDGLCDVYGFGVTLYEMLTARVPYNAHPNDSLRDLRRKMQEPPTPPSHFQPTIPTSFDELMCRILSPISHERPGASELLLLLLDQAMLALAPGELERIRSQCAA